MKTIFVVDDTETNLFLAENALNRYYFVVAIHSAEKMFSMLEKITPDIILLDVDMPKINGFEAIKILKSKPETKDIPVIFLTSRSGLVDRIEGLSLGAVDYIIKPFKADLLHMRIETHLLREERRNEQQRFNLTQPISKIA